MPYTNLELNHRIMVEALKILKENLEHSVSKEVLRDAIVNTAWEIAGIGSVKTAYAIIDAVLGMEYRSGGITPQTDPQTPQTALVPHSRYQGARERNARWRNEAQQTTPQTAPPVETCEPCKRTVNGMQSCCPFHPETRKKQPTVREINAHLASDSAYCYVRGKHYSFRISRAKSESGVVMGRVICGTRPRPYEGLRGPDWEPIPVDADVELS